MIPRFLDLGSVIPSRSAWLRYRLPLQEDREQLYGDDEYGYYYKHSYRLRRRQACQIIVIIPGLVFASIIGAWFMMMDDSILPSSHLRYSTVTGYFLQDKLSTDPSTFDYISSDFGLINRTYDTDEMFDPDGTKTQWERFESKVRQLNREADGRTQYKVLFMGRHGDGYHNAAERYYGTEAWNCYWSRLDGNDAITWSDARLTEAGEEQARVAHAAWEKQIEKKIPFPESFYVSPLHRCLETASITFEGLDKGIVQPFRPVVKEFLRETLGIHTCDRRSSKSAILEEYAFYRVENGFTESDPLWDPNLRESSSARGLRLRRFLDDIFETDDEEFISLTAHGGAISSILQVVGHRRFPLATGAMVPVLVKAERVSGPPPRTKIQPSTPAPTCEVDSNPPASAASASTASSPSGGHSRVFAIASKE